MPCYINEADIEKPLLTIFTCKNVNAGEELCFSYAGRLDEGDFKPIVSQQPLYWLIIINHIVYSLLSRRISLKQFMHYANVELRSVWAAFGTLKTQIQRSQMDR